MKARTVFTLITAFAGLVLLSIPAWAVVARDTARSTHSAQLAAQALPFSFDEVVGYFRYVFGNPTFKVDDGFFVFVDSNNPDESLSPPWNRKSLSYFLRLAISALITSESFSKHPSSVKPRPNGSLRFWPPVSARARLNSGDSLPTLPSSKCEAGSSSKWNSVRARAFATSVTRHVTSFAGL